MRLEEKLEFRDNNRKVRAFLFNAPVVDFQQYLRDTDVTRLVARNIRFGLGKAIARDIRETYERRPLDFWYLHNGLTIVCDEFKHRNGTAKLINLSVINGAQTLDAINGSTHRKAQAKVTVRVIVRSRGGAAEDDVWLQRVIRGVNTQNRVLKFDFSSNEPEQIELQHLFEEFRVFYERKRGEWKTVRNDPRFKGFLKLSLKELELAAHCRLGRRRKWSGLDQARRGTRLRRQALPRDFPQSLDCRSALQAHLPCLSTLRVS